MDIRLFTESDGDRTASRPYLYVLVLLLCIPIMYHTIHQYGIDAPIGSYVCIPVAVMIIFITAVRAPIAAVVLSITAISAIIYP